MKLHRQALELFWHRALPNYFRGLFNVAWLFTIGWLRADRGLLYNINRFYGTFRDYPVPRLPQQNVEVILNRVQPVTLLEPIPVNGNVSLLELLILVHLVRATQPKVCLEIGTFDGRTTLNLAANAPLDARILTLDLPVSEAQRTVVPLTWAERQMVQRSSGGMRFQKSPYSHRIQQLFGDSASFDFTPWQGGVDFIFIDGAHTYDYVRNDTEKALKLLRRENGIILWHDYAQEPGVTTYLNELYGCGGVGAGLVHIQGTSLACLRLQSLQ